MRETVYGLIIAVLSQVFVGLVLGLLWNYTFTELGYQPVSASGTVSGWLGMVLAVGVLSFVVANMFKSVLFQVTADIKRPESKSDISE